MSLAGAKALIRDKDFGKSGLAVAQEPDSRQGFRKKRFSSRARVLFVTGISEKAG